MYEVINLHVSWLLNLHIPFVESLTSTWIRLHPSRLSQPRWSVLLCVWRKESATAHQQRSECASTKERGGSLPDCQTSISFRDLGVNSGPEHGKSLYKYEE
uniref:Uncharacterized protein n=1 Tax=Picea sitchensis TaxID=3332 RepID=D5A8S3_PICSI|nr:unknown [Picea sitchensis]